MHRRSFLGLAASAALASATPSLLAAPESTLAPMELGLLIAPSGSPDASIQRVHDLGFTNCFISLDGYLGHLTPELASSMQDSLRRLGITVTTVEVVGPKPLEWNFKRGPATIGLVPPATRAARLGALQQASDFAHRLGITQVQTHCGFIPEDPADPLYQPTVDAIRNITRHCAGNGQHFLMETGQETPTTMARTLKDVNEPNLAVGLDTANVILYGKARPTDVVDILGPHIRSIHAKDGKWPTNPDELGEEVLIGKGLVDFHEVFRKLRAIGYKGAVTIERETNGPQQVDDVRAEKLYLEKVLRSLSA